MDSKEIKSSLKQAREAIKEKDFKSVLKHCKNVFKLDKNNYNAWVFVGVAAQETGQLDQAVSAYKKAIEISPNEVLAWQGLCSFCEKQTSEDYRDDLMNAYTKLVELYSSDKAKQLEILTKLLSVSKAAGNIEKIIETMKLHLELVKGDPDEEYSIWKGIFQELLNENDSDSFDSLRETACQQLLQHNKSSDDGCPAMCASYVKQLLKSGQKETAVKLANQIYSKFPDDTFSLELLCRVILDVYISSGIIAKISDDAVLKARSQLKSGIGFIVQGITSLSAGNYAQAIKDLKEGLERSPSCLEAWLILCKIQLKLHRYEDAETSAKEGLRCAVQTSASSDMLGKFYLLFGKALSGRRNYDAAMKVLEKCVDCCGRTSEMLVAFTFILLHIGQLDNAEKVCDELLSKFGCSSEIRQLQGYLCIKQKKYADALLNLKKGMTLEESAFSLHLVALTLWEMNEHEKAFKMFLKATESDPYNPRNFLYLGHYYKNKNELRKAVRCYDRAFSLDNFDEDIALSLSTTLKTLGDEEENYALLKFVTKKSSLGRFQWAWIQLGLYQLERNDATNAVFSIQTAIRSDPSNSHLWECLGDAYFMRGSHESSLKAFENASNLDTKALYPLYQVSTIQKLRGLYLDAIEKFRNVLRLDPSYVPALIGLAETYVLLAKKSLSECVFGQTKYCCQEALYTLSKVVDTTMGLSCLWKLAGDACTLPFHLDDSTFPITVPGKLNIGCPSEDDIICHKRKLLEFGAKFYGQSLSLQGNVSTLWHDLGVNCYFQSFVCSSSESEDFARKALLCLQKAISVSPTYHAHWNSLGVISVSKDLDDFALAQHAFIKSMEVERINAEAWTSLGVLYLVNGNIELAHNALKIAQSLEPSYPLSWVSQAIIADSVEHTETMDLFRHATTLGSHPEALLGYSRMVCRTLLETTSKNTEQYKYNIVEMDAVVVAADCMIKYTANDENNPEAFNMQGMLLERLSMRNGSLKAYKRSVELLMNNGQNEDVEKVRANCARLLSYSGYPKEAIKQFLMLKNVDTALLCSFGFALYKDSQFREAFKVLQQAFQVSKNVAEKSHILVSMAMVALNIKDSNAPNPLKLLFESSQMKPPSVLGLLALCAVGIMKKEASLTFAALKELHPLKSDPEYSPSVGFLSAACHYQTDKKKAFRELLKAVHDHPGNNNMWMQLASSLLSWDPQKAHLAAGCAVIAVQHLGDKETGAQIFALCQLMCGYRKVALRAAQKALHTRPDKLANWTTLAAACHVAEVNREHVGWLFTFVKKLAKQQGISSDLLNWLIVMEIFHFIYCKDLSSANNIISTVSRALESSSVNPVLLVLDAIVKVQSSNGKLDALLLSLKKNPGTFLGWQTLVQLLIQAGKFPEAEKTLKQFSVAAKTYFPKWECFPLLQLAALSYQAMHTPGTSKATWLSLAEESVSETVKSLPTNKACRLMQGLIAVEAGNVSLARRSFEHVLSKYNSEEPKWMDKVARHSVISCYVEKNDLKAIANLVDRFPEDEELSSVYEKLTFPKKKKDYFDYENDV